MRSRIREDRRNCSRALAAAADFQADNVASPAQPAPPAFAPSVARHASRRGSRARSARDACATCSPR
ncbi:MAG: hypothetical protein MZW92_15835 [Comamonadaceae bacterium]|nr:hypothetical protein [Comamonadaceae bacterium]